MRAFKKSAQLKRFLRIFKFNLREQAISIVIIFGKTERQIVIFRLSDFLDVCQRFLQILGGLLRLIQTKISFGEIQVNFGKPAPKILFSC